MKHTDLVGSGYGATVVPCHSCIQPLDALGLVESTGIQRLDAILARYHSCVTGFPDLVIPKKLQLKVNYSKAHNQNSSLIRWFLQI